ncbi:MAG: aspartate kinase [Gemmatimonadetes bacterium]|nr:aspartate kinase [Gemmatimonadota bacterium]
MIVQKFGGTSVEDAAAILRVVGIVTRARERAPLVVVSAIARATATLVGLGATAARGALADAEAELSALMDRHRRIAHDLELGAREGAVRTRIDAFEAELFRLLGGIDVLRECTPRTRDHLATFGERMSSHLLAEALVAHDVDAVLLDAFAIMVTDARFGRARPDRPELERRAARHVRPVLEGGRVPVLQGYIGATPDGVPTTMGFEASDFTATLMGAVLGAEEIQIWTDVAGMLTADNRVVPEARTLPRVSFAEAEELAHLGARVIHPDAVRPAAERGISVRILDSRAPDAGDTLLDAVGEADPSGVRSVALLRNVTYLRVAPVPGRPATEGFARWVLDVLARHDATLVLALLSERSVALVAEAGTLGQRALEELGGAARLERQDGCALVSVAGAGLADAPDVPSRALGALVGTGIRMIAQGSSPLSLSVVVPGADGEGAVRTLHSTFIAG